ncbi:MAG: hypothetical protein K2R98_32170 [Gemmataceae bacterium]|nr:hypothetical protein [Gemmataceae bacterium]
MNELESRSSMSQPGSLSMSKRLALTIGAGATFGFAVGWAAAAFLGAEHFLALCVLGLVVGACAGIVVGRLMKK